MPPPDRPLERIRILSDGRPGHENQSAGLAAALARRTEAVVETVRVTGLLPRRLAAAANITSAAFAPQLVIGAGHNTHIPLLYAAARFRAVSVVIMSPTLPSRLFDLCFVPAHDLRPGEPPEHIVLTRGALNRIPEERPAKEPRGLILVGGPSKHHGWDSTPLINAIREIVNARPELTWTIGDSRRTPAEFMAELARIGLNAQLVSHAQTTPEWVPSQLLTATEAWVTEDSISMIHEAVTAGARTGLLPAPLNGSRSRVLRAVKELEAANLATTFDTWSANGHQLPPAQPFHETARCAELVLERFFSPRNTG